MDQQDAVVARLRGLEAENRKMKRVGAATLGLLAVGLFGAMAFQNPETTGAENVVADQDGEVVTAYRSEGSKAWQGRFVDGKREGPWIVWASRWTLLGQFKNDKKVGTWRKFSNGDVQLIEEGSYGDGGLREGLWSTWRNLRGGVLDEWSGPAEPPPLESSGSYLEGKRNGMWTFWHWNRQKRAEGRLEDGKRVGDWKFWLDGGAIDEEQVGVYEDGVKIR